MTSLVLNNWAQNAKLIQGYWYHKHRKAHSELSAKYSLGLKAHLQVILEPKFMVILFVHLGILLGNIIFGKS